MRRVIAYSFLAVIVLVTVVLGGLATPIGRGIVANVIERAASVNGLTVTIDDATGWPPFWIGAEKITLADVDGIFAEIDELEIDVNFAKLVRGTVGADLITVGRMAIDRAPKLEQSGASGTLLPFAADRFVIAALTLGDGLVGRPAVLTVDGSASNSASGNFQADVSAKRTDGTEGSLSAQISRAAANVPFAADIEISEAADGILIGLIGRESGPAYRLAANAAPEGDAIRGAVTLSSDDAAQFTGRFALAPDGGGRRLQIAASGDLAELMPAELAGLLSGSIDIGLDADWADTDGTRLPEIAIRQGRITTATVDGTISGKLSRDVADLSFRLDVADPTGNKIALPIAAASSEVERVSLRGTVAPAGGIVRADLVGNVTGLDIGGTVIPATGISLAIESESGGSLYGANLPFALRVEADAIRSNTGTIEATTAAPLLLTLDGTIDTTAANAIVKADLSAAGGHLRFDGDLSAQQATGTASAMFEEVASLSGIIERTVSGGVEASARGTFFGSNGIDLNISADLDDFDPGQESLARLLRGRSNVKADFTKSAEGAIAVSDLELTGDAIEATAEATLRNESIEASLSGAISDLASLADRTAGSASFTADVSGALSGPQVDAAVRVEEGELLGYPIRDGIARLFGRRSADGWTATATLGGSFADRPLAGKVEVDATAADGSYSFPDIDVEIDENRITGALERTGDGLLSGTLDVDAPNLATLAALALTEVGGSAEARLTFMPDEQRQAVTVTFNGGDISYRTFAIQSFAGEARIDNAFGTPQVNGSMNVTSAQVGSTRLDTISANASAEGDATTFQLAAKGANLDLTGAGALMNDAGVAVLRLDTISGSAYRVPMAMQSPVTIRFDDTAGGLPSTRIAVGGGSVTVDGAVSPELNLSIVVARVPASVINGFAPNLEADGTFDGRATVSGTPASPRIDWQMNWSDLQTAASSKAKLPPLQLSATGRASLRESTIDGVVTGGGSSLTVKGSAPFAGDGLALTVAGPAPLTLLALETKRELRLAGNAQLDLRISGSAKSPGYAGTVTLADATVIDGATGFGVTGASGRIVLDGRRASTEQIGGRLSQGGQVTLAGSVDLGAGLQGALRVNVANGRYNDGQVVDATFDASLAVNGPLTGGATMSGTVALGRTEIQLPDRLTVAKGAIEVTHVNAPPGFVPPLTEEKERAARASASGNLRLDVELTNSGGIFVRGFGVDAEFGGSLRITNTISDPVAAGAFTMRRGRVEVIGRRFELVSGTLTFAGDLVPVVDFNATATTSDAIVTVSVTGPANQPTISFTSNPDLPEEEILSQLLFNRSVATLSVVQVAQLLDAASQFSGGSSGQSFFGRIRNALGVDDLDIRQNASGGTTVGVGKRINDNVSLGVEAGSDGERVTIDLDLTPNLKARGSAGSGGSSGADSSIGLTYEREY